MYEEDLNYYLQLHKQVERESNALLVDYREIFKEILGPHLTSRKFDESCFYVEFSSVQGYKLNFQGDETWNYGGREHYNFDLPLSYLYDPKWKDEVRAKINQTLMDYIQGVTADKRARIEQEKQILLELKSKYPEL